MIQSIIVLTLITFIPTLELRASIPVGIFGMQEQLSRPAVILICIIANIILGWAVFWIMGPAFQLIRRWPWFDRKVWPHLEKTRHKIHPYVE